MEQLEPEPEPEFFEEDYKEPKQILGGSRVTYIQFQSHEDKIQENKKKFKELEKKNELSFFQKHRQAILRGFFGSIILLLIIVLIIIIVFATLNTFGVKPSIGENLKYGPNIFQTSKTEIPNAPFLEPKKIVKINEEKNTYHDFNSLETITSKIEISPPKPILKKEIELSPQTPPKQNVIDNNITLTGSKNKKKFASPLKGGTLDETTVGFKLNLPNNNTSNKFKKRMQASDFEEFTK